MSKTRSFGVAGAVAVAMISFVLADSPASAAAPAQGSTMSAGQVLQAKVTYEHTTAMGAGTHSAIGTTMTATQKSAYVNTLSGAAAVNAAAAQHCWSYSFSGSFGFIYNNGAANWCGDGTWVGYANSTCGGHTYYPTNKFDGCTQYKNYGVGWSLYQVKFSFHNCYAYIPVWGSCAGEATESTQFRFTGGGAVYWNGGASNLR